MSSATAGRPSALRRRVALACVLAVGLAASVPAALGASSHLAPAGFFGVGGWSYPSNTQAATLGAAGLRLVRGSLAWGTIQTDPDPASRNWSDPDRLMQDAAADHFNVLFDLDGCAVWACGAGYAPPSGTELAAYEAFVQAAVERYAPGSPFWGGRRNVPTVSWQIWNEVNGGYFWPDPTPAAYATFLSEISTAIRAVDPTATIVLSGLDQLPGLSTGMRLVPFLRGLYRQPEFRSSFNVVAIQGYAPNPTKSIGILDQTRRVMLRNGDGARPIWVTEMGWAAGGPPSAFTVSPQTQQRYLVKSWDTMVACRRRWNLKHVLWFSLQDFTGVDPNLPDYWGYHDGLIDASGVAKPAYASFLSFLGRGPFPGAQSCPLKGGMTVPGS
ncbi:MAG: hypothetical protein ABR946_11560 [Solirubrobacteraceae bacterium]